MAVARSARPGDHSPGPDLGRPPRPVTGDAGAARPVLDAADVSRVLRRIAHEILEKTGGGDGVVLLGIPTRGSALSRRLADTIEAFEGVRPPTGQLDVTLYRDDLRLRGPRPLAETALPPEGIDDAVVVLVDDVLFSGRTVRAALDALSDLGRPRAVQLAVLVDRGHRELPIRADYVGKNLPTSLAEVVHVQLAEYDGHDAVLIGPADLPRPSTAAEPGGPPTPAGPVATSGSPA
jgi:pyrimidine operon attenuation protein / uracil phosphoribosyltransferase